LIAVIGAGLSGLSAAYHLGDEYRILEGANEVGGLCKSLTIKGYTFDLAPHIFYTKNQYVSNLVAEILEGNLTKHQRKAYIYFKDRYIEYPFESNLNDLPEEIRKECVEGALYRKDFEPKNFLDWIYLSMGSGVAKHYMIPYNEKVWKFPLEEMNYTWISGRVPSPNEKIKKNYGPNAFFLYPYSGGIGSIPNALAQRVKNISLSSKVLGIKINENEGPTAIYRKEGSIKTINTEAILSSIPLPELVKITNNVPEEIIKAAEKLVYNSLICLNLGVNRPMISDKHWIYFPEKEYPFNRISFPTNFSTTAAPEGKTSILVEVTYREKKPDLIETKDRVIDGLVAAEILNEDDELEVSEALDFEYAYVIYDFEHSRNTTLIQDYLQAKRVYTIGRFGEWEYHNMDNAILSGKLFAEKIRSNRFDQCHNTDI
jgi:protoporphyrinogen oxidase